MLNPEYFFVSILCSCAILLLKSSFCRIEDSYDCVYEQVIAFEHFRSRNFQA